MVGLINCGNPSHRLKRLKFANNRVIRVALCVYVAGFVKEMGGGK